MRALAEFIMRGRTQAAIVAILGIAIPVLTPATIAFVSLRKGPINGALILLWGLLPMLGYLAIGSVGAFIPVSALVVAFAGSLILRSSVSWSYTLMALVAFSSLTSLLQLWLMPEFVAEMTKTVAGMFEQVVREAGTTAEFVAPGQVFFVGMIAYITAISGLCGILVGRWWQALLYNPGGFAGEFQQFRLNVVQALVCVGAAIYCLAQPADYRIWAVLFVLPLLVMGVAIVHRFVAVRRMGKQWLVGFYLVLFFVNVVAEILVIAAFLDTWLNFRGRFKPKQ